MPTQIAPTPETDSFIAELFKRHRELELNDFDHYFDSCENLANFARNRERERDEARSINKFALNKDYYEKYQKLVAEIELWRDGEIVREEDKAELDQLRKHLKDANRGAEINAHINAELIRKRHIVEQENEQLRKVCDELASLAKFYGFDSSCSKEIADYNSLPHVKAKRTDK